MDEREGYGIVKFGEARGALPLPLAHATLRWVQNGDKLELWTLHTNGTGRQWVNTGTSTLAEIEAENTRMAK